MKTPEEVVSLILIVQDQNASELKRKWALNDLVADIAQYRMDKFVAKYIRKITVSGIDEAEIRQTYLIGCSNAIAQAKINVGDPMMFIIQKGKWAVADLLRKVYRKQLRQYCHCCNSETRVHEVKGKTTCPKCGATGEKVELTSFNNLDDGEVLGMIADRSGDLQDDVISNMTVQEFRSRLSGRKLDVFDLIVMRGFDRGASTNYIKDVASALGVTSTNVSLRLRSIREEWHKFMEEEQQSEHLH